MKILILAGEESGVHYARLIADAVRARVPSAEIRGYGDYGFRTADLAVFGIWAVLRRIFYFLGVKRTMERAIDEWRPDVVCTIDYPGMNLKLAAYAKRKGVRAVHVVCPQVWAWHQGRVPRIERSLDRLCYILPFEEKFFADNDMPQAVYVGHPLLDAINDKCGVGHEGLADAPTDSPAVKPVIALLPGSRRQELKNSLPQMVALTSRHPEYRFVVAGMSIIDKELYNKLMPAESNIEVVYDRTYDVLRSAYAAVVCSGTATLETALFNVPQVVCYRANPITIAIAKAIVSSRIRYISLVNLIADSPIVTELIQEDFNANRLEAEFIRITADADNRKRMQNEYANMRLLLGDGGASERTADEIISLLK